jgi:uncharacterized protein
MMRRQLFVDVGYLIALYDNTDKYHSKALEWSEKLPRQPRELVTTSAVLLEFGDGFCKEAHYDRTLKFLDVVLKDQSFVVYPVNRELVQRARDVRVKY